MLMILPKKSCIIRCGCQSDSNYVYLYSVGLNVTSRFYLGLFKIESHGNNSVKRDPRQGDLGYRFYKNKSVIYGTSTIGLLDFLEYT